MNGKNAGRLHAVFSGRSMSEASASAEAGQGCWQCDKAYGELYISFSTFIISHRQGFEGSSCSLTARCIGVILSDDGRTLGEPV